MNKGTAIVGFFLCFLAGMGLMWGLDRKDGVAISAEGGDGTALDHSAASIPVSSKDPQWGSQTAPVTVVEISDFECPFCKRANETVQQLKSKYGKDKLRVVWKHHPLPFHKNARGAHEAAATVFSLGGNDAFWKFHDLAFENTPQGLNDANYEKWAAQAGVDAAKFKEAYSSKKYAADVDEDMALAQRIGASGTPAFRINGITLVGAQPIEKFSEIIDAQLAEAAKLKAAGTPPEKLYVELTKKNFQAPAEQPQQREAQQPPEDTTVWKVPVFDDDPSKGPKDALVTIVTWSDFQCPFCKRVLDTEKQIMDTYKNDVRIVWKDNALPFHNRAIPAAILGRVAYKQKGDKGFWDAHDAMFEIQPKLEDEDLKGVAEKIGLNWDTVKKAIDANQYKDKIDQSMELAADLDARGTPAFFINGRKLSGAQPFDAFKKIIDAELEKAKALVAKGTPRAKVYEEVMKNGKEPPPPEKKDVPAPPATAPSKGPANAKVTMQVFSEFQCPFCKRVEPTLQELAKEYGNKLRIVWRDLPLPFHQDAPLAAEAAREAYAQKGNAGFWKFHDALFENQGGEGLKRENLEKIAEQQGLDMAKFKAALDNRTHKAAVDADAKIGQTAGIQGTPSIVINGYYISGAQPTAAFKKVINRALKEAK